MPVHWAQLIAAMPSHRIASHRIAATALVRRPDAWEADDPRAGEADLIIAEHRNGPTTTVAVAHQLHYSRFADLAG